MLDFIAIDFETANSKRTSACALGITTVQDGKIIDSQEYFIKPYPFYFDSINTSIHGINEEMVSNSPTFDELWAELSPKLENKIIVAHNASFDISVLKHLLEYYNIPFPSISFLCTYRIAQFLYPEFPCYRLDFISSCFNVHLIHHNSVSDSIACSELLLNFISSKELSSWDNIQDRLGVDFGFLNSDSYLPCRLHSTTPKQRKHLNANDFQNYEVTHIDDDFVDKNFAFTGTLISMSRSTAMEIVARGGGKPQNSITKKTNYLVVGMQDLKIVKDGQSTKMKKAAEYKSAGCDIIVIGEDEFLNMIDEELYHQVLK